MADEQSPEDAGVSFGDTATNDSLVSSLDSFSLTSLLGDNNQSSVHPPTINTGAPSVPSETNATVIALGSDATKLASAFFVSKSAAKIAASPNSKYLVYGGVAIAAFVLIYFLTKK